MILTQGNFAHQIEEIPGFLDIGPDDVFLSILPPWHIFERIVEYVALTQGARLVYTDLRHFRQDLAEKRPTFVPSVPRVWESVHDAVKKSLSEGPPLRRAVFGTAFAVADARARAFDTARGLSSNVEGVSLLRRGLAWIVAGLLWPLDALLRRIAFRKVQAMVGGRLRGAVVGGGKMPPHVDRFFRAIGVGVLVGYGLTETSPVVTVRRPAPQRAPHDRDGGPARRARDPRSRDGKAAAGRRDGRRLHEGAARDARVPQGRRADREGDRRRRAGSTPATSGGSRARATSASAGVRRRRSSSRGARTWSRRASRRRSRRRPTSCRPSSSARTARRSRASSRRGPRRSRSGFPTRRGSPRRRSRDRADVLALVKDEVARRTGSGSGLQPFEVVNRVALLPEPLSLENGVPDGDAEGPSATRS